MHASVAATHICNDHAVNYDFERLTSSGPGSTTRTRTTGWPVVIDSITCAGSTSVGDSVRIQRQAESFASPTGGFGGPWMAGEW